MSGKQDTSWRYFKVITFIVLINISATVYWEFNSYKLPQTSFSVLLLAL